MIKILLDKVKKYYDKNHYDLNCAETIVYAANEEFNMNLDGNSLKSAAAFGGGMAIEDVCGVVTGSLIILGILFTKKRAHESDRIKTLTTEYITRFQNALGTLNCKQLKAEYKTDLERCSKMLYEGAVILENIINREMQK